MSELAVNNTIANQLDSLTDASGTFKATFDTSTEAGQDMAFSALSDSVPLNEHLGEVINLVHFVGQAVTVTNETTGELVNTVRTVLIDDKGNNYSAVSDQLLKSLSTMVGIYGIPAEWKSPKAIVVTEQRSGNGRRFFSVRPATKSEREAKH